MGVSDELWYRLTCPKCSAAETLSVSDHGSTWGGPAWGDLPRASRFDVASKAGGGGEPEITAATCNACGSAARVENRYGFKRPDGW
jgi:hypothetical protein